MNDVVKDREAGGRGIGSRGQGARFHSEGPWED